MVGQNLMVGHVLLGGKSDQSYLAMSFDTFLWLFWCVGSLNFGNEEDLWLWNQTFVLSLIWTSPKNDTPWKRWEKCLWAWPLRWSILLVHPLLGFVLKIGKPNVWKKLKIKCPDMTNGIDLRLCPHICLTLAWIFSVLLQVVVKPHHNCCQF